MNHEERELALKAINMLCRETRKCDDEHRAMVLLEAHKEIFAMLAGTDEFTAMMNIIHSQIIRIIYDLHDNGKTFVPGIYAILFGDGMVKIGKTKSFSVRLKMLSDQSTSGVSASKFFPCENHSKAEAIAHAEFADCRVKNEFFKADFDDVVQLLSAVDHETISYYPLRRRP